MEGRKKKRRWEELKVRVIENWEKDIKSQHIFHQSLFSQAPEGLIHPGGVGVSKGSLEEEAPALPPKDGMEATVRCGGRFWEEGPTRTKCWKL